MTQNQILFSRWEHGAQPVIVLPDGWLVGESKHTTARSLLAALTGHPEGRHWSPDRYFKVGPVHGQRPPLVNVFDVILDSGISVPKSTHPRKKKTLTEYSSVVTSPIPTPYLGIDLSRRALEVRKLLYAGFGRRMYHAGYDPEDVLQEVYKGLLVRNAGRCPWDPEKSSFGHYVHMVISCVLSNYHRKQTRIREDLDNEGDVSCSCRVPLGDSPQQRDVLLTEEVGDLSAYLTGQGGYESHLACQVLPLMLAGQTREVMAQSLGVRKVLVTRAISFLREQTKAWKELQM